MLLSVIVPCYNEEEVIADTHRRLLAVLGGLPDLDFEVLYVDDGSKDRTWLLLHGFAEIDPRVRAIRLSRNFGHQIALSAGIEHAGGDAVVFIDADLQDPPEVISEMVAKWREGFEVVYGVRTERPGETAFKRWSAKVFYRVLNTLSEVDIPVDTGDFRLIDRKVVDALLAMPEQHRFLRGMVRWVGYRQAPLPYRRDPRLAGSTKYSLWKMVGLALNGIISFSSRPLRFATWLGFAASGIALVIGVYVLVLRLFTQALVTGWTSLVLAVLFMGGVQLVAVGVMGEYVARIYGEAKMRPLYVVAESSGLERQARKGGRRGTRRTRVAAGTVRPMSR